MIAFMAIASDLTRTESVDMLKSSHSIFFMFVGRKDYIPEDDPLQMIPQSLHIFLESIRNQSATAYGGDTFIMRFRRAFFETKRNLKEMWLGKQVLTSVLFGLPLGFLLLILYSIFCGDCLDAPEEEDLHEKKE